MTHLHKIKITLLKNIWLLAAIAIVLTSLLTTSTAMAAGGGGATPAEAVTLVDDTVYVSALEPGEQHWFKFTVEAENAQPGQVQVPLTLIMTPDTENTTQFFTFKIFEEAQLPFYFEGDISKMTHLGAGQAVLRDQNPETAELFWNGWVLTGNTYYILLLNESDFVVDYRLFRADLNVPPPQLGEPETPEAEVEAIPDMLEVTALDMPEAGVSPLDAPPLPTQDFQRRLQPGQTDWFALNYPDFTGQKRFEKLDFSVFFTPDDGNRRHKLNFELYATSETEFYERGEADRMTNFGAGRMVSRDGDYNTAERIWRGAVLNNNTYLMAIENKADVEVDYWLFHDDIYNPVLGPEPIQASAQLFAEGKSPQTAMSLNLGLNKGALDPGEEQWYSFLITDFKEDGLEQMALTLITTPDDGNRIRNLTFDIFTPDGAKYWSPGNNAEINNIGAGSVVYRDSNPETGERFWHGWVQDNNLYLVQLRNGTDMPMDYWLYTGDVYQPSLSDEEPQLVAQIAAAPGEAPGTALDLQVGVNQGELEPGAERWYKFNRGDANHLSGRVGAAFTLIFTPDDGNRVRDVNLELFEANQLRDWAPDNRFNIKNFGKGSVVNRDGRLDTGELVWQGHVQASDYYYMRVSNESDVTIEYQIFPEDIINSDVAQVGQ
jgi:hypothetical protein